MIGRHAKPALMAGGRFSVALAFALSTCGQGCSHASEGRVAQTGGAHSAAGESGALSLGGTGGARSAAGASGDFSAGGSGNAPSAGGAGGALAVAGGAGILSDGGSSGTAPEGGAGREGGVTVSLDFAPSLSIANRTLLFPLNATLRPPSESEPGDLIVAYTRAICASTTPETLVRNPFGLGDSDSDPVLLTALSITQDLGSVGNPSPVLAKTTCLTLRTPEGHWQAFLLPANVSIADSSARFEFAVPAVPADAAAIFLPTYTAVSNPTYTIRAP